LFEEKPPESLFVRDMIRVSAKVLSINSDPIPNVKFYKFKLLISYPSKSPLFLLAHSSIESMKEEFNYSLKD